MTLNPTPDAAPTAPASAAAPQRTHAAPARSDDGVDALLGLRRAVVGYHDHGLLPPIDLAIMPGTCWALIGRNGGGKSTLLRSLVGLLPLVCGERVQRRGARVAFVPQRSHFELSVPTRVADFVAGGVDTGWRFLRPWLSRDERATVARALELTETTPLAREAFASLSEGQKQRVLIARALACRPDVLVLDEPTSAMDPVNERVVFALLAALCGEAQGHHAVLLASHQMSFLPQFADHTVLVDKDLGVALVGETAAIYADDALARIYGALPATAWAAGGGATQADGGADA